MTRAGWTWAVLAFVGVVGLVAGLGYDERTRREGEAGLLDRTLMGEPTPGTRWDVSVELPLPEEGAGVAKTQVAAYDTVTCTVQIAGIEPAQTTGGHPMEILTVDMGAANVIFQKDVVNPVVNVGGVDCYKINVSTAFEGMGSDFGPIYVPIDGELHDYPITIEGLATLHCTRADSNIIGDKTGATHAKERVATDAWVFGEGGRATALGQTYDSEGTYGGGRVFSIQATIDVDSTQGHFNGEQDFFRVADISWNGAAIDASLCNEEFEPGSTGGSNTPENVWMRGSGSMIRCMQDDYVGTSGTQVSVVAGPPTTYSFTGLHVTDMDGSDLSDLVIWFTGAQWYDATAAAWEYRGYTLAEWQALTLVPNFGLYSWDAATPPDGALKTLATAAFYIDRDSARTHQLDGFAETA